MRGMKFLPALLLVASAFAGEPPTQLQVNIGLQQFQVEAGKSTEIILDGKPTTMRVEELPIRHFAEAGIRFDYPRHFPWEHDTPHNWTLDGNNAVVMVNLQEAGEEGTPDDVLDGMIESLKLSNAPSRIQIQLSTRRGVISGVSAIIPMGSTRIRNEVYLLKGNASSVLLVLQDTLGDNDQATTEFTDMRKRLSETLEY